MVQMQILNATIGISALFNPKIAIYTNVCNLKYAPNTAVEVVEKSNKSLLIPKHIILFCQYLLYISFSIFSHDKSVSHISMAHAFVYSRFHIFLLFTTFHNDLLTSVIAKLRTVQTYGIIAGFSPFLVCVKVIICHTSFICICHHFDSFLFTDMI